jgi:hypothetical protein
MKTISYIIGYRLTCDEDKRLCNLIITINWLMRLKIKLKTCNINLNIIIIEQDVIPKFNITSSVFKQIEYLFIYNSGFYNRGWGFNVGYKNYVSDYYFFGDGDIIMNENDMINVFTTCFKYDAVNPYKEIYDSTEEYMKINEKIELINLNNNFISLFPKRENTCFSGGIMGISEYSMSLLNGWDERFRGRGWEDYAFTSKIELFLYSTKTYGYLALHLWHPYETNTTRIINEALNLEYETYDFYDYLKLIDTYISFGSPIKYAFIKHNSPDVSLFKRKKYISDYRYYYAKKFFYKLLNKYNSNKHVYLYLCNQLDQLTNNGEIKESGCC